jgi:putative addiction module component (TIGR02574 family)
MDDQLIKKLRKLNTNEKLLLVEALWDSIAEDPEQLAIPEHHKTILEARLQTLAEEKAHGSSWDELREKYL